MFGLQNHQKVSDIMESVIASFEKDILPNRSGLFACDLENLIRNETSPFVEKLYGTNALALVYDGTYLRHGKSSNNAYQKRSYSGQEKDHLCKPFTIGTTTGYIVTMLTPANANLKDADIMKMALQDGLQGFLQSCDYCSVERGFRDVERLLEDMGYVVCMPVCSIDR